MEPKIFKMRTREDQLFYGEGLKELIKLIPEETVLLEIGVYIGESSRIFLDSGKIKTLYCLDPWENVPDMLSPLPDLPEIELVFDENMKSYKNMKKVKSFSQDALRFFEGVTFDMVYIDGDHSYEAVLNDIQTYLPKIKKGGIIAGHDYCPNSEFNYDPPLEFEFPGVVQAVNEVFGAPDKIFIDTSWIKFL